MGGWGKCQLSASDLDMLLFKDVGCQTSDPSAGCRGQNTLTDGLDSPIQGDDSIKSPFCQKRLTISLKPAGIFFSKAVSRLCERVVVFGGR